MNKSIICVITSHKSDQNTAYTCYLETLTQINILTDNSIRMCHKIQQVYHFGSLSITLYILFKTKSIAMIVLRPKQNIECELKWKTSVGTVPSRLAVRQLTR